MDLQISVRRQYKDLAFTDTSGVLSPTLLDQSPTIAAFLFFKRKEDEGRRKSWYLMDGTNIDAFFHWLIFSFKICRSRKEVEEKSMFNPVIIQGLNFLFLIEGLGQDYADQHISTQHYFFIIRNNNEIVRNVRSLIL